MQNYTVPKYLLGSKTAKMDKSAELGWTSYVLHLAPIDLAVPGKTVCPKADAACRFICLNTSGRGRMTFVQKARANKTRYFWADRPSFLAQLKKELATLQKRATHGEKISVRLN